VDPKADLEAVVKREKFLSYPCRKSIPDRPARSLVTLLTEPPWHPL